MKNNKRKFRYHNVKHLLKQLIIDIKPSPRRLDLKVDIQKISKDDIEKFCNDEGDLAAYEKMAKHELVNEPAETVIVISQKNKEKISKKQIVKVLQDLGYNVNVLMGKNHGSDFDAAVNINGYSIPGWKHLINFFELFNSNLSIFFGKRFAPGRSRLHIRVYEGVKSWYVIAHVDKYNWISFNFRAVKKSHVGSGAGDYKNGTKGFLDSLEYYFSESWHYLGKNSPGFKDFILPSGDAFLIPEDLNLEFPKITSIDPERIHYLVYIPWEEKYFSYIANGYKKFFQYVLPYLNIRTTDVHTARSLAFTSELIKKTKENVDERIVYISLILHDIGWSRLNENEIADSLGVRGLLTKDVAVSPKRKHAVLGRELAKNILNDCKFTEPLSLDQKETILKAVLFHDSPEKINSDGNIRPEIKIICDADHLWSFTHENFWQDTVRKKINPVKYVRNLQKDLNKYFTTGEGRQRAGELLRKRKAEVEVWKKYQLINK
jgi:hypothetical protein